LWSPASAGCFDNVVAAGACGFDINKWYSSLAGLGSGIQGISSFFLNLVPAGAWENLLKTGVETIDKMTPDQIQTYLTVDRLSALSQSDWENLLKNAGGAINNFTPAQIKAISPDALKALSGADWETFLKQGTAKINDFTPEQIKAISVDALKSLTQADWEQLLKEGVAKIDEFTPEQVKAISVDALSKLKSSDIHNIAINTLKNMDKAQIEAMWDKLSPEQKAALDVVVSSTPRAVSLAGLSVTAALMLPAFAA
jgi:hypothetical protein